MSLIRLVVADGQPLFTLGVRTLLAGESTTQVVGEAQHGAQTLDVVGRARPDVLLLDLAIEGMTALEVLSRLGGLKLATRTVVMTTSIDTADLRTALMRGARGVLLKHTTGDLLVKCVRQVMRGEYWIGRDQVGDLVDALRRSARAQPAASALSPRERDIVSAVVRGASNKDIAAALGLGEQTIKNHLRRIFAKVGVANRVELAVQASAGAFGGRSEPDGLGDEESEGHAR